MRAWNQFTEPAEQVFQAQVGANAFVERIFVEDHAKPVHTVFSSALAQSAQS
jgi:hypothetical protein